MESVIVSLIGQSPGAAGVIIVVIAFLRHQRAIDTERRAMEMQKHEHFVKAMDRCTEMMGKNVALLERVGQKLSDFPP